MPNVSISSDHLDYISEPEKLAKDLAHYLRDPNVLDKEKLQEEGVSSQRDTLMEIIHLISDYSGVNFRNYKPDTLIRRIEKRMKINQLEKLLDYEAFLQKHPKEVKHVFDDLFLTLIRMSLRKVPYLEKLTSIENVEKARDYLNSCLDSETSFPDAIFVDLNMPGMNGMEFAVLYSENFAAQYPKTKRVMLTSSISRREKA